jgi:hypothetical protein
MLDVRTPIGWLFIVYGILLVSWSFFKPEAVDLQAGQQINLNLVWGLLMGIFGLLMKFLVWLETRRKS